MKIKQAIAERFVEICEERGIKPNELATMAGGTPSTVYSMFDPSRKDIYISTVKRLCDGLDININEFFNTQKFSSLEKEID